MSKCLLKKFQSLKRLAKCSKRERNNILRNADEPLISSLCECASNTLSNRVPLKKNQYSKLKKYKVILRSLAKGGEKWQNKKKKILKHVSQSGGYIIPILISAVTALLQKYI